MVATLLIILAPFVFLLVFADSYNIPSAQLFTEIFLSFYRMVIAYLIAAILGWVFAISFFRGRRASVALPIFDVLQSFPTYAALPLAVAFLGESDTTVIIFLTLAIIWPIFFSIISSLKLVRHDWEEMVEVMNIGRIDYLRYYLIPMSMHGLITGSIIGLGDGWEALVATEIIVGIKNGLGGFFNRYSTNVAVTIFGITGFLFIIFSINKLIWSPLLEWSHKKLEE